MLEWKEYVVCTCVPLFEFYLSSLSRPFDVCYSTLTFRNSSETSSSVLVLTRDCPAGPRTLTVWDQRRKSVERETLKYTCEDESVALWHTNQRCTYDCSCQQLSGSVLSPTHETTLKQGPLQEAIIILRCGQRRESAVSRQVNIE